MKRTVNPTGKSRIIQDNVSAHFDEEVDKGVVEVTWDLTEFDFDLQSELIFETYSMGRTTRDQLPLAGNLKGTRALHLADLAQSHSVNLFIRVVSKRDGVRLILAESAAIPLFRGSEEASQESLLKVQPIENLPKLWDIDYSLGEPVLQVNNRDQNYPTLVASGLFLGAILPSVVEEIAFVLITNDEAFTAEVFERWLVFLGQYGLTESKLSELHKCLEDEDLSQALGSIRETCKAVAAAFAEQKDLVHHALLAEEAGE